MLNAEGRRYIAELSIRGHARRRAYRRRPKAFEGLSS
jgi:hypothetical protein